MHLHELFDELAGTSSANSMSGKTLAARACHYCDEFHSEPAVKIKSGPNRPNPCIHNIILNLSKDLVQSLPALPQTHVPVAHRHNPEPERHKLSC